MTTQFFPKIDYFHSIKAPKIIIFRRFRFISCYYFTVIVIFAFFPLKALAVITAVPFFLAFMTPF